MRSVIEPQILAAQNPGAMEEWLWSTLGAAGVARWTRNLNGSFHDLQPSWSAPTGQTQSEPAGFGWRDAVHPDDRDRVRSHWTEGAEDAVLGYRLRDATGTWREVDERTALRLEQIGLRTPLRLAIEACASLMESRGQSFEEAGFERPITMIADPTRVAQMVPNLLNNATKYTPPRGHIRLELSERDGSAGICVIDDGVGLAPEALERVFNMFEQVRSQKAQAEGGLGIGPALTRHLVQPHGGLITVHSEGIGRGCRFSITLPCPDTSSMSC